MKKILIIDDDCGVRQVVKSILGVAGFLVNEAPDGESGVASARQEPPDLILCDIVLPHNSGFDVLAELGRHPATSSIPTILITGSKDERFHAQSRLAGADDFIEKPFTEETLLLSVSARIQRHEALLALRSKRERRLLSIVDRSGNLVAIATPGTNELSYLNPAGRRMLRLESDTALHGITIPGCFSSPEATIPLTHALEAIAQSGTWAGEILLSREGMASTPVWLQIQGHGMGSEPDDYITLVANDISQSKLRERQLRRMSSALEQSPVAILITDLNARIEYINPRFSQITGYTLDEIVGRDARFMSAGQTSEAVYQELWEKLSAGGEWHGEFLNRKKQGPLFWTRASISCILNSEGQTTHFLGVLVDITEEKNSASALAMEQQLMGALMDNLPDAIYFKDIKNRFIRVNRSMAKRFNLGDPKDVEGKTDFDFFSEEHAKQAFSDELNIMRTGIPVIGKEEQETWPDRPATWVSTTKMPLRNAAQEIVGTFGISFDITRRKTAEEERSRLEQQLHQSQKLESIGQLAAGIAHEINTPTQYVSDNIQFVQKAFSDLGQLVGIHEELVTILKRTGCLDQEMLKILSKGAKIRPAYLLKEVPLAISDALEGLERVTKIVRAMKQFSHPGTEEMVPSDLNRAIESTLTVSRNEWKYVADVVTQLDPSLPLIPCLPGEFNQVILNLVVNAAHAIGEKVGDGSREKGTITVSTRCQDGCAEIEIKDTGTGIPEHVRPHIFEHFFTTKEIGKGTGQGLALARAIIVDQHGGTLHFETQTGQGTSFIIRLPLQQSH